MLGYYMPCALWREVNPHREMCLCPREQRGLLLVTAVAEELIVLLAPELEGERGPSPGPPGEVYGEAKGVIDGYVDVEDDHAPIRIELDEPDVRYLEAHLAGAVRVAEVRHLHAEGEGAHPHLGPHGP